MSLDLTVYFDVDTGKSVERYVVGDFNYTHNCGTMAAKAGIYEVVWRPEEIGIEFAGQVIEPLEKGIRLMESDPARFEKLNPSNGCGSYKTFLPFLKEYLEVCREYPKAKINASR